ncbi:MAG TPA: hypothetical protein VLA04_02620 [Verrucomicrobiae bacterium]|nr:hypothetical protein [Verrucomicrobiae bacterium]
MENIPQKVSLTPEQKMELHLKLRQVRRRARALARASQPTHRTMFKRITI